MSQRFSPSSAESVMVVHLVHGTWPEGGWLAHRFRWFRRHAPRWYQSASELRRSLEHLDGLRVRFCEFHWSGRNSFAAREAASKSLTEHLSSALASADESEAHVVVAHSHGGTVALASVAQLPLALRTRVHGVATFATPFVSIEADAPPAVRVSNLAAATLLGAIGWSLSTRIADALIDWFYASSSWSSIGAQVAWSLFFSAFGTLLFGYAGYRLAPAIWGQVVRRGERTGRYWTSSSEDRYLPQILVMRSAGDEASLALASGELASRFSFALWRVVTDSTRQRWPFAAYLLAMVWYARPFSVAEIALSAPWFAIYWFIGFAAIAAGLYLTLGIIVMAAFGPDAMPLFLSNRIAADAAPHGVSVTLRMISPSTSVARHSLPENPNGIVALGEWLSILQRTCRRPVDDDGSWGRGEP